MMVIHLIITFIIDQHHLQIKLTVTKFTLNPRYFNIKAPSQTIWVAGEPMYQWSIKEPPSLATTSMTWNQHKQTIKILNLHDRQSWVTGLRIQLDVGKKQDVTFLWNSFDESISIQKHIFEKIPWVTTSFFTISVDTCTVVRVNAFISLWGVDGKDKRSELPTSRMGADVLRKLLTLYRDSSNLTAKIPRLYYNN